MPVYLKDAGWPQAAGGHVNEAATPALALLLKWNFVTLLTFFLRTLV